MPFQDGGQVVGAPREGFTDVMTADHRCLPGSGQPPRCGAVLLTGGQLPVNCAVTGRNEGTVGGDHPSGDHLDQLSNLAVQHCCGDRLLQRSDAPPYSSTLNNVHRSRVGARIRLRWGDGRSMAVEAPADVIDGEVSHVGGRVGLAQGRVRVTHIGVDK